MLRHGPELPDIPRKKSFLAYRDFLEHSSEAPKVRSSEPYEISVFRTIRELSSTGTKFKQYKASIIMASLRWLGVSKVSLMIIKAGILLQGFVCHGRNFLGLFFIMAS